jgi:hypothetical protein
MKIKFKAGRIRGVFKITPCLLIAFGRHWNRSGWSTELHWMRWAVGVGVDCDEEIEEQPDRRRDG